MRRELEITREPIDDRSRAQIETMRAEIERRDIEASHAMANARSLEAQAR